MKTTRIATVASLLALAGSAAADRKTFTDHGSDSFSYDTFYPAGPGNCDFDLSEHVDESYTFESRYSVAKGTYNVTNHINMSIIHSNDDSGYFLTEDDRINDNYELLSGTTEVDRGLFWHLRTPDGKLVLTGAGKITYDFSTDPLTVTATPNAHVDEDLCAALGGHAVPL